MTQETPLKFNPIYGYAYHQAFFESGEVFRDVNPDKEWTYNPWTGGLRDMRDIISDPLGLAIVPSGEALVASSRSSREKFEDFWKQTMNVEVMPLDRTEFEDQQYQNHDTNRSWMTWQAAMEKF